MARLAHVQAVGTQDVSSRLWASPTAWAFPAPILMWEKEKRTWITLQIRLMLVEYSGLEPLTSTLPVSRSSQMS